MGGKDKKSTTSTYRPPNWVEDNARFANEIGRRIGQKGYTAYQGNRVAGLSANEQQGMDLASRSVGIAQPYYDKAADYADRATASWADADQSKYINPYIKGALDPAAREIREQGAFTAQNLDSRASSMDAFGGSRAALMRGQNEKNTLQGISDLYKTGYADAYNFGAKIFGEDRAREMEAAGRFETLGGNVQNAAQTDISTLMTTGATDRAIQQAMADFDYQQFIENRDWDFRQLMGVVSALEGSKGSYTTTQTEVTETETDNTAAVIGAIATVVAAAYTGGASTAVTGAAASDERLKDNIVYLMTFMGRRFYTWTWKPIAHALGIAGMNYGVIAQENPDMSFMGPDGFLRVDYSRLTGGRS